MKTFWNKEEMKFFISCQCFSLSTFLLFFLILLDLPNHPFLHIYIFFIYNLYLWDFSATSCMWHKDHFKMKSGWFEFSFHSLKQVALQRLKNPVDSSSYC